MFIRFGIRIGKCATGCAPEISTEQTSKFVRTVGPTPRQACLPEVLTMSIEKRPVVGLNVRIQQFVIMLA